MGRTPLFAIGIGALLAGVACAQPASQSWELRGKDWQPVATPDRSGQVVAGDPTLDEIAGLIDRGRGKDAFKRAVAWLKMNRGSPERPRALYLAAQGLYVSGDRIKSFYYLDELLDLHAESDYFAPALDMQYKIADDFLKGYKARLLGIPIADRSDEAVEMLFRIQQRAPGSRWAQDSIRRTADYYFSNADYDLAGDAYAAYVRTYPRAADISEVRLQQAYSYQAQFRDVRFDATPIINARAQFTELMSTNPQMAEEDNIAQRVDRIDSTLARKTLVTAEWYKRTRKPRAAAYLYQQVLKTYPNTPEALDAQQALDRLPPEVRDEAASPPAAPTALAR